MMQDQGEGIRVIEGRNGRPSRLGSSVEMTS